jgi:flavin reductase (DIM6/NTAB) family NADH-FMN oxidoreductase RutF
MPVAIVAAEHDGRRSCSTATAMYAALDPVALVISLAQRSATASLARASGWFSVSLPAADQVETAIATGRPAKGDDKFAEFEIPVADRDERFVVASLADARVAWCCRISHEVAVGDHAVIVGEVVAVRGEPADERSALLRHDRRYVGLGEPLSTQDQGGYPL